MTRVNSSVPLHRLRPRSRAGSSRARLSVLLGTSCLLAARSAHAWEGREHEAITKEAVSSVCCRLEALTHAPDPQVVRRTAIARALLCSMPCPGGEGNCNMFRFDRSESCDLQPEQQRCPLGFPAAVALVDYKNDSTSMRRLRCGDVSTLRDSLKDKAYEALVADEHFHPSVVFGYSEALEIAQSRAIFASSSQGSDCPDLLRRALFNAARALHLIEDAFSAGHSVTRLRDNYEPRQTTYMHDRYNKRGVLFGDRVDSDSQWRALGDKHLDDPENAENRARAVTAATTTLCNIVRSYIGPGLECAPLPTRPGLLVPELMDEIKTPVGLGGLRLEFASFPTLWQGPVLRYSSVARVAVGLQQPVTERLNLQLSLYGEVFSERGFTHEQYDQGALHRSWAERNLRGGGLRPGVEYSSLPWERLVGITGFFNTYLGWADTDCSLRLGCIFDGAEVGVGVDLYPQLFTLRVGPTFAVRRSDVRQDEWAKWLGITLSGLIDRFNLD
jgi:hypothetical protein